MEASCPERGRRSVAAAAAAAKCVSLPTRCLASCRRPGRRRRRWRRACLWLMHCSHMQRTRRWVGGWVGGCRDAAWRPWSFRCRGAALCVSSLRTRERERERELHGTCADIATPSHRKRSHPFAHPGQGRRLSCGVGDASGTARPHTELTGGQRENVPLQAIARVVHTLHMLGSVSCRQSSVHTALPCEFFRCCQRDSPPMHAMPAAEREMCATETGFGHRSHEIISLWIFYLAVVP